jgi:hypothetical protein
MSDKKDCVYAVLLSAWQLRFRCPVCNTKNERPEKGTHTLANADAPTHCECVVCGAALRVTFPPVRGMEVTAEGGSTTQVCVSESVCV